MSTSTTTQIIAPPELSILKEKAIQLGIDVKRMKLQNRIVNSKIRKVARLLAVTMRKVEKSLGLDDDKDGKDQKHDESDEKNGEGDDDEEEEDEENKIHHYSQKISNWLEKSDFCTWSYSICSDDPKEMFESIKVEGSLQEQEKSLSDRLLVELNDWKNRNISIKDQESKIKDVEQEISRLKKNVFDSLATIRSNYPWYTSDC